MIKRFIQGDWIKRINNFLIALLFLLFFPITVQICVAFGLFGFLTTSFLFEVHIISKASASIVSPLNILFRHSRLLCQRAPVSPTSEQRLKAGLVVKSSQKVSAHQRVSVWHALTVPRLSTN